MTDNQSTCSPSMLVEIVDHDCDDATKVLREVQGNKQLTV